MGRIRAEDEDLATVPFLASDNEEEDDDKTASGRYDRPSVLVLVCQTLDGIYICVKFT